MKTIHYIFKFFICIIIAELKLIKVNIGYLKFLFLNVNLIKYFFFIFDRNINPIKSKGFQVFLNLNKKKWEKLNNHSKNNKSEILVESFLNQQTYAVNNILIGKYLEVFTNSKCIGLLRAGDIKGRFMLKSFGIKKFYTYKFGGLYNRIKYIFKSIKILRNVKNINDLCNFKFNKIDIGLLTYDTWIRYTRTPTSKIIDIKLILFFAEALFASDFFSKLIIESKIRKLIQAEKQFIPFSILFQTSLQKNVEVYARHGIDKISVRIYNNFNQRHNPKNKFSKELLNSVYKDLRFKAIKSIDIWFKSQIKNKFYGRSWAPYIQNKKNVTSSWEKKIDGLENNNKNLNKDTSQISNLKEFSKHNLCKNFGWSKNKKIVTVFLPYMIDGVYQNGRKKLFLDNYTWIIETLKIIKRLKNVNWIIKEHPQETRYNTKSDYKLILMEISKNNPHIKACPKNINPFSLTRFTDIALTCNGSPGLEYQSFGIPAIIAEKSYYSHFGFPNTPKNIFEYKKLLNKIHLVKNPKKNQIEKAKIILFVSYILSPVKATFLPDNIPEFESRMKLVDEEKYWSELIKNIKRFNFKKDPFRKMFEKQIFFKHRHTINFQSYKKLNKKLNDFS